MFDKQVESKISQSELKIKDPVGTYIREAVDYVPEKKIKLSPPKLPKPAKSIQKIDTSSDKLDKFEKSIATVQRTNKWPSPKRNLVYGANTFNLRPDKEILI